VGQAWEDVSSNKEMVKRSFVKTGIAVAVNGSQDTDINIRGLANYQVDSEDDSSDPFSDDDAEPVSPASEEALNSEINSEEDKDIDSEGPDEAIDSEEDVYDDDSRKMFLISTTVLRSFPTKDCLSMESHSGQ
jgi:hypothetical protein